ncbi:MAG: energy transducer TonB [Bacteroidia bacterium]|nr:energy transducer TonB [Bacteroidia bacterium]
MSKIIFPLAFVFPFTGNSQSKGMCAPSVKADTIWFDYGWNVMQREGSTYYRVYTKAPGGYNIFDRYRNHSIQMTAFSTTINPVYMEGEVIYYNINGFKSCIVGFKKNQRLGPCKWYYKNETDSAMYTYMPGGNVTYQLNSTAPVYNGYNDGLEATEIPCFEQGVPNMFEFIRSNLNYPAEALAKKQSGQTIISFVVKKDGTINGIKIDRSSGFVSLDQEAMRIVKLFPKFKAGRKNGVKVDVPFYVPIKFVLPVK